MNSYEKFTEVQQTFKTHLNQDKKYQPILKKLVVLLREIKPETTEVFNVLRDIDKTHAKAILDAHNKHQTYENNIERSLEISIKKNKKWMDTIQKQKNHNTTLLQNELRLKLEAIDDDIEKSKIDYKIELVKLETIYKRELSNISKTLAALKKTNEKQNTIIEHEKADTLSKLKRIYDQKISSLNEQIEYLGKEFEQTKVNLKVDHDEKIVVADNNYLQIKNDYTQLSIHLNQKINEIKKVYQKDLEVLKNGFEKSNKPLNNQIEKLKIEYKNALQQTIDNYQEKLNTLNLLFDQQKENYETKKQRIINEINQGITLLNSKLSAFREGIQKDKLQKSRTMRAEMKSMETTADQDKHNHLLTRLLNQFDQDLNRQIIRTQKDIDAKHSLMQKKLFDHDQAHLKEINNWRLTKQIYSYEHKQELAKLELNYNYNLNDLMLQLKRVDIIYVFDKDKRLLNHNRDLLPLEYQLTIGSLVQERELNLLSNDTHQVHDELQHVLKLKNLEYQLNLTQLNFDQKIAKINFQSDEAVLLTMTQLELQKEKLKYESGTIEQTIRKEIQDAILGKNKESLDQELKLNERQLTLAKYRYEADTKKQVADLNHESVVLFHRQTNHLEKLKLRTLHLKSIKKTQKIKKTQSIDLEKQQQQLELLVCHNIFITRHYHHYLKLIEALYLLPAHPEVFKTVLNEFISTNQVYTELALEMVLHFKALDLGYYQNKIEDRSSHKGHLKFDHQVTIMNTEIERNEKIREEFFKEVKQVGSQILTLQTAIEKEIQHTKLITQELSHKSLGQAKQNELQQHLKDYEKNIAKLSNQRDTLDQKITHLHKKMVPLDEKITTIESKKALISQKLKNEKSSYQVYYQNALSKNTHIYESLEDRFTLFKSHFTDFMNKLTGEVYVTDSLLKTNMFIMVKQLNQLNAKTTRTFQQLINQISSTYHYQQDSQNNIADNFKKALDKAINQQERTYLHQIKLQQHKHQNQLKYINRAFKDQMTQVNKEIKTYKSSYQMRLDEFVFSIRQNEKRLENEAAKFVSELKMLNDNQIDVAKAYQNDHQNALIALDKQLDREKIQLLSESQTAIKLYDEYLQSTALKNKALILKHEVNHQKQVELLKAKKDHYTQRVKKETLAKDRKVMLLEKEKNASTKQRNAELKNMRQHLIEFSNGQKREQNSVLRRELRILRKSYRFKLRALKLHP